MSSSQSAEAKKTEKGFLVTDCVTRDKCQHMEMRRDHNTSRDKQQHKTSLFQMQKSLKKLGTSPFIFAHFQSSSKSIFLELSVHDVSTQLKNCPFYDIFYELRMSSAQ